MKIDGRHYRTIWRDGAALEIIDQTALPHRFVTRRLTTVNAASTAIAGMAVRGAPLIGAMAAYGIALAMTADASDAALARASALLLATRPTAVNLRWALARMEKLLRPLAPGNRAAAAFAEADRIAEEDVAISVGIGRAGLPLIEALVAKKKPGAPVNILTHCNAGWLATVDWGTATAPVYLAHDAGIAVHVWVDETRPRNQGAALTAFELGEHGVPHTLVVDNAGGHLMQKGLVDLVIVGTDRTTAAGDVCNKIGTYLKALAARDNDVPFYVAVPGTSIDWGIEDGTDIPIEERAPIEVTHLTGRTAAGEIVTVDIAAPGSAAANPAFDVTPARLVTGLVTERGVCAASRAGLAGLYPEQKDYA